MKQTVRGRVYTLIGVILYRVEVNKPAKVVTNDTPQRKRTVRNIVFSPLKNQNQKIGERGKLNLLL